MQTTEVFTANDNNRVLPKAKPKPKISNSNNNSLKPLLVSDGILEILRYNFRTGRRVKLERCLDPSAPPVGTRGTVRDVLCDGTVMVNWDTGINIGIVFGRDLCVILKDSAED